MTPTQLFESYAYYRQHTQHAKSRRLARRLKRSAERLDALQRMTDWCIARGFDPEYWLYSLFAARRWFFAPRWDQLCSEKNIRSYHAVRKQNSIYQERVRVQYSTKKDEQEFSWWRDVGGTSEALKRRYRDSGTPFDCYYAFDRTYGYHPRSIICPTCPVAELCKKHLRSLVAFDILALREGRMPLSEARTIEDATKGPS